MNAIYGGLIGLAVLVVVVICAAIRDIREDRAASREWRRADDE